MSTLPGNYNPGSFHELPPGGPLTLTSNVSGHMGVYERYSQLNVGNGGTPPYTFTGSTTPAGLQLSGTAGAGDVRGRALTPGPFSYTVTVTDSVGATVTNTITGIILPVVPGSTTITVGGNPIGDFIVPPYNTLTAVAKGGTTDPTTARTVAGTVDFPPLSAAATATATEMWTPTIAGAPPVESPIFCTIGSGGQITFTWS